MYTINIFNVTIYVNYVFGYCDKLYCVKLTYLISDYDQDNEFFGFPWCRRRKMISYSYGTSYVYEKTFRFKELDESLIALLFHIIF